MKLCVRCKKHPKHSRTYCKECIKLIDKESYRRNRTQRLKRKRKQDVELRRKLRKWIVEFLEEHPCVDCGEVDPVVLEFDHVRGTKYDNVSRMVTAKCSLATIQREIDKCDVRCANCHRRITAKRRSAVR